MKFHIFFLLASLLFYSFSSCEKKYECVDMSGDVEIYLLKSFNTIDESCRIDEATVVLKEQVLIAYEEMTGYYPDKYAFELTNEALNRIIDMEHSVWGTAFAVLADGELIYTGYFWPAYSSLSCSWYVMDPVVIGEPSDQIKVKNSYPGEVPGLFDPDRRNDQRILCIFDRDGKLKD